MLLSIVSVSAVCLALAYSGWDATDFPPGTEMTQTDMTSHLDVDNPRQWRDGMLQWLLIYNEESDDPRDCCRVTITEPDNNIITLNEKQLNNTNKVFRTTILTFEWKGQRSYIDHHDVGDIPPTTTEQNNSQKSVNTDNNKPTFRTINDIISENNNLSDNVDVIATNNSIAVAVSGNNTATSCTDGCIGYLLDSLPHWSSTLHSPVTDKNNKNTNNNTGDACYEDKHLFDEADEDLLSFLIIRLLMTAIFYKYGFSDKRRLRLPKGVTETPVLYRRGKHLELGLSKYLRHRTVSKSQIAFPYNSYLNQVNFDRPGLELTRRFLPDFQNPWLYSRMAINESYLLPASLLPSSPYLSIKSLDEPGEAHLKPLSNISVACDGEDRTPETPQPHSSDSRWKSLETQFTQLSHNINYMGSNTTYYEKTSLLLAGYLIRSYYRNRFNSTDSHQ